MRKKIETIFIHTIVYALAIFVAWYVVEQQHSFPFVVANGHRQPLSMPIKALLGNVAASICILLFSCIFNSFSLNDPYWTLSSSCYSVYYLLGSKNLQTLSNVRTLLVLTLVNVWSVRLTFNLILTGFNGITHEDWRFSVFRAKWKPKWVYFLTGFVSFILLPNMLVYISCLSIYNVANASNEKLNGLDYLAVFVTVVAITFEAVADYQLRSEIQKKRRNDPDSMGGMDKGLWSLCRHPNYFGEVAFWFGLYLFGIAASGLSLTTAERAGAGGAALTASEDFQFYLLTLLFGPCAIFALIYFGSLPMMEQRQLRRRESFYRSYMKRVTFKMLPLSGMQALYKAIRFDQNPKRRNKQKMKPKMK
jgi:steroid 5-alpha reductase family enzyme